MILKETEFFMDTWATDENGDKVYPYKGERGDKKGLFSVNFTNDTKKFQGMSEAELVNAITSGRFKDRGTIRMLPLSKAPNADRNAFAPLLYKGKPVKDF